jgi:hypothetical protein
MKLADIQATIDAYFDQISEQDLFELLTNKYQMPIVYDIEMASLEDNTGNVTGTILGNIQYPSMISVETHINQAIELSSDSTSSTQELDKNGLSDSLSYAA